MQAMRVTFSILMFVLSMNVEADQAVDLERGLSTEVEVSPISRAGEDVEIRHEEHVHEYEVEEELQGQGKAILFPSCRILHGRHPPISWFIGRIWSGAL